MRRMGMAELYTVLNPIFVVLFSPHTTVKTKTLVFSFFPPFSFIDLKKRRGTNEKRSAYRYGESL